MKKIKFSAKVITYLIIFIFILFLNSSISINAKTDILKTKNVTSSSKMGLSIYIKYFKAIYSPSKSIKTQDTTGTSSNSTNDKQVENNQSELTSSTNQTSSAQQSNDTSTTQDISIQTLENIKISYTDEDNKDEQSKQDFANRNNILSQTDFFIWVHKSSFTVNIFQKANNSWLLIKEFPCSIGASATPTIEGIFQTSGKESYFVEEDIRCYYATRIFEGYMFHTILYNKNGIGIYDDRIGMQISHGCIRLEPDDAKYIYENIPLQTTVYIN